MTGQLCCGEGFDTEGDLLNMSGITFGVVAAWLLAMSYRVGLLLAGHYRDPSRFSLELPGCNSLVVVPTAGSFRWFLWIVIVVLFGLLHPAEAHVLTQPAISSTLDVDFGQCQALVPSSRALVFTGQVSGDDSWAFIGLWAVAVMAVVVTWTLSNVCAAVIEHLKQLRVRLKRRVQSRCL